MCCDLRLPSQASIHRPTAQPVSRHAHNRRALAGSTPADAPRAIEAEARSSRNYLKPAVSCRLDNPQEDPAGAALRRGVWAVCQMEMRDAVARTLSARMAAKGDGLPVLVP